MPDSCPEERHLGEICELISRGRQPAYVEDGPVRAIGQRCVRDGRFLVEHTRAHDPNQTGGHLFAQTGDVLLNSTGTGTIGRTAIFRSEAPCLVDSHVTLLRPRDDEVISYILHEILAHPLTQREIEIRYITGSTNQIELLTSQLGRLLVRVPCRDDQPKIADILDAIDDAILETHALIEKHQAIRLGLLDDLIARPAQVGQSGAPDKLADVVASISSGCSVNADDRPPTAGEFGVLKTSAVGGGRIQPHQSKAVWKKEEPRLKCPVTKGTIIFNRKNTPELVGGSAYVDDDFPGLFLPDLLWSLQVEGLSDVDPAWVATLMQTRPARAYVTRQATGTSKSMVNISQPLLLRMPLRRLPERDQADAMKAVRAVQIEIDTLTVERVKLSSLREGLRDDLLTGRKSVAAIREAAE